MPFRLNPEKYGEFRAKVQFTTFARMPKLIYEACKVTGTPSNTVYVQRAVCEALARDLGLDLAALLEECPRSRGPAAHLFDPDKHAMDRTRPITEDFTGGRFLVGPANTVEEVR